MVAYLPLPAKAEAVFGLWARYEVRPALALLLSWGVPLEILPNRSRM